MKLLEDPNDGMKWLFVDYRISLKQSKETLPPRGYLMEFYVKTNKKELERNPKLQVSPIDLQDKFKEVVTEYWDVFCEDGFRQPIRDFYSRLTQVTIYLSTVNHLGTVLMILRL